MKNPLTTIPQRLRRQGMFPALKSLNEMENEMDRFIQGSLGWPLEYEGFDFSPTCNVKETSKEYIVHFDIPGVKKDEIKIELDNNRLSVSGERKEKKEEKDSKSYFTESYYGSFMRSFTLPSTVDQSKVDASFEDGVLTVKVPKSQASTIKEIKIH
ncbi:MAG: Hsp20/alpha crystallin family protein [Bacteriovorax sp.]